MNFKSILIAVALLFSGATASAQGLSDILKGLGNGDGIGSTISNALQGIFTKTDLSMADIVGSYESTGPAVSFKSDNFLQKAGGIAGAAALESKLQPYYEQYGLTGMTMTVMPDSTFTMNVKRLKLSGDVVCHAGEGTFTFNVKVGGMKVGQFTAYVQKSGKNLDLMFDANKLKQLISMVAKFSGQSLATAAAKILDSYEGACIGFNLEYKGSPDGQTGTTAAPTTGQQSIDSAASPASGLDALRGLLKSRKK